MSNATELDQIFDKVIQEAIDKANHVKCSMDEYRSGLHHMRDMLDIAIEAAGPGADQVEDGDDQR